MMPVGAPPPFRLRPFGAAVLERVSEQGSEVALRAGKPLALLQMLCVADGRPVTREQLADQLWGDESAENARASLRQAVYALRLVLGDECLQSDRESVTLRLGCVVCDRQSLIEAARRGDFETMLRLAPAPFWEGSLAAGAMGFERWADAERRRLDGLLIEQASATIPVLLAAGDAEPARRAALALAQRFPDRSDVATLSFDTLVAIGAITEASERLSAHAARLLTLEYTPPPEVEERLARLRRRSQAAPPVLPGGLYAVGQHCVGRDPLLLELLREAEQARNGSPRRLLLVGPAGVGKTRVLDELEARLRLRGARVVRVGFLPGTSEVEFSGLTDVVRALAALPGSLGVSEQSARRLLAIVPELAERFPGASRAGALVDGGIRGLPEAVDDLLAAVAEDRPVVLMLDNMDFADLSTLRVFASTILRPGSRLLAIGTSRRGMSPMLSAGSTQVMEVLPLSEADIRGMLRAVAALPDAPWMQELVATLLRRSRGIPQVALAAVRSLGAAGLLRVEQATWRCDNPTALLQAARDTAGTAWLVDGLEARARELLDLLSAWGRPLEERDLAGILAMAETPQPLAAVREQLRRLEALGLIQSREATWGIAHDNIAEELREHPAPVSRETPWDLLLRYWTQEDHLSVAVLDHLAWIASRDATGRQLKALVRLAAKAPATRSAGLRGEALAAHTARAAGRPEMAEELRLAIGFWGRRSERTRVLLSAAGTVMMTGMVLLLAMLQPRLVIVSEPMVEGAGPGVAAELVVQPRVVLRNGFGNDLELDVPVRVRTDHGQMVGDTLRRSEGGRVQFERLALLRGPYQLPPRDIALIFEGPWYVRGARVHPSGLNTAQDEDEFRIVAFSLNGAPISDSLLVRASLRDSLRFDLTFEYTTIQATANYIVGAMPMWAPRERGAIRLAGLPRPVFRAWRTVTFSVAPPDRPGEHYLVVLMDAEDTVEHMFSSTNWQFGAPVWNDGNDISDLGVEVWESLRTRGSAWYDGKVRAVYRTQQAEFRAGDSIHQKYPGVDGVEAERLRGRALKIQFVE